MQMDDIAGVTYSVLSEDDLQKINGSEKSLNLRSDDYKLFSRDNPRISADFLKRRCRDFG